MKKLSAFSFLLLSFSTLLAQTGAKSMPFTLKGHLTNCAEKEVWINFQDGKGNFGSEAAQLDEGGNFLFKTTRIKSPGEVNLLIGRFGTTLFAAPGYSLSLQADVADGSTFAKTKEIAGIGVATNRYHLILDSIAKNRKGSTKWYEIEREEDFVAFIKNDKKIMDSVAHAVFQSKGTHDPYYSYFGKLASYDAMFQQLSRMFNFINRGRYSNEQSSSLLKNNFDNKSLTSLIQDRYLISTYYRDFCFDYATYLVNSDYQKDSTLRNRDAYKLERVNKTYTGATRELVLFNLMMSAVGRCESLSDLNNYKKQFTPYLSTLKKPSNTADITSEFSRKEKLFEKTQAGQPAFAFTLRNNLDKQYSLQDFKGKVLYIDLWASWCVPCRAETPKLKALYEKYKNDDRIAIISIAVDDAVGGWRKALTQDKPDWLQLFDSDGLVYDNYVIAGIPQFVIIDKEGKIVNLNAPRPGDVEELLVQEIRK